LNEEGVSMSSERSPQVTAAAARSATLEIVTGRLLLRLFQAGDLPAFVAYHSDPDVARYQSWDTSYGMADAKRFLAEQNEVTFGQPGAWMQLAATDRGTGALVGDCAIRIRADQPQTAELGVTFSPRYQGAGLAAEAMGALVDYLFEHVGLHRVFAETDDRNDAAQRLFARLGFRCEGRLIESERFKDEWCTLRIYALLRREWELSRPATAP
jgi:RimJ/RimL family protein N-acetyltransferase